MFLQEDLGMYIVTWMYIGSVEIMDHGDHLNLTHQQKRRPGGRGTYAQPGEHQTRRLEICEPVGKRTYVHN